MLSKLWARLVGDAWSTVDNDWASDGWNVRTTRTWQITPHTSSYDLRIAENLIQVIDRSGRNTCVLQS